MCLTPFSHRTRCRAGRVNAIEYCVSSGSSTVDSNTRTSYSALIPFNRRVREYLNNSILNHNVLYAIVIINAINILFGMQTRTRSHIHAQSQSHVIRIHGNGNACDFLLFATPTWLSFSRVDRVLFHNLRIRWCSRQPGDYNYVRENGSTIMSMKPNTWHKMYSEWWQLLLWRLKAVSRDDGLSSSHISHACILCHRISDGSRGWIKEGKFQSVTARWISARKTWKVLILLRNIRIQRSYLFHLRWRLP